MGAAKKPCCLLQLIIISCNSKFTSYFAALDAGNSWNFISAPFTALQGYVCEAVGNLSDLAGKRRAGKLPAQEGSHPQPETVQNTFVAEKKNADYVCAECVRLIIV